MDQAKTLRDFIKVKSPVATVAITSGKGGVGKTTISIVLSAILAKHSRVCLVDGDLGLANVDIVLGLSSKRNIYHLATGEADIEDVLIKTEYGFYVLPGGSGIRELLKMDPIMRKRIAEEILKLDGEFDYIIADTAAGISDEVMMFCVSCNDVIVISTPEPTSITDSYAIVKTLRKEFSKRDFKILLNMVKSHSDEAILSSFEELVKKFVKDVRILKLGSIKYNEAMPKIIRDQSLSFIDEVAYMFEPIVEKMQDESIIPKVKGGLGRFAMALMRFKGA